MFVSWNILSKSDFRFVMNSSSFFKFSNCSLFVENELIISKLFNIFCLVSGKAKSFLVFSLNPIIASLINSSEFLS